MGCVEESKSIADGDNHPSGYLHIIGCDCQDSLDRHGLGSATATASSAFALSLDPCFTSGAKE